MRRFRLVLAAWLLLLIPAVLIGALALRLLSHEEERLAGASAAAASERAQAAAQAIDLSVSVLQKGLLRGLRGLPAAGLFDALEAWRAGNPLIRNVFAWDPAAGLVLPRPGQPADDEEASFLRRYESLFHGHAGWGPPPPDGVDTSLRATGLRELATAARSAAPAPEEGAARGGWLPWHWEDQLHLLGWIEPAPGGRRYGVEVETVALLARLTGSLPRPAAAGEVYALIDGNGTVFHQTGSVAVGPRTLRLASAPIGPSLPHWEVAVYGVAGATRPGRQSFLLLSSLLVGCFVAAILLGGSLLLWQAVRSGRDAARKTTFVSNVSHELKTPLTTIRMYAELLAEGRIPD
ncbi:MAG: hypothetical protein HY900_31325 [Deltaproteobacteria bacterium]|nr:hypothetical protein [Deltaproteobacteria bacterium]